MNKTLTFTVLDCHFGREHVIILILSFWEGTCHHFDIDITVQDNINAKK